MEEEAKSGDAQMLEPFAEDFALFIEAGFVAVKQFDETSSTRLFQAAQVLSPDSTAPQVGLGFIALNKLDLYPATKIFESVTKKEPDNYLAKTFLGICYLLNNPKRKQGEKLIKEAMESTEDPTVKHLGQVSLKWSTKDLNRKRKPSPIEMTKEEKKQTKEKPKETPPKE